jgi:dTDP-4-amino-4,6-dideoxygalactose transaminase
LPTAVSKEEIMIPCASPRAQYQPLDTEILAAIHTVLESGHYILGPQVGAFENEFARYLNIPHAVGCGSGTDALVLALRAYDIGAGDEVIVPSHTATATVAAVTMVGATPVFADIDPDFYTLNACEVESRCTSRTKAIVAVHLYGQAADIVSLQKVAKARKLLLIEDCAQAVGADLNARKLGTLADIGCYSFFPTKNLGAIGDAGAVVCRDAAVADRLRRLRQYGWDEGRTCVEPGINSRLDEIQAAILRVKLPRLDVNNAERVAQAERYRIGLAGLPIGFPKVRPGALHCYHLFVLRVAAADRDRLIAHMSNRGVVCGIHYAVPVHKMPGFAGSTPLPVTEAIVNEIVSLPLFPGINPEQQDSVIRGLRSFYGR